MKFVVHSVVWLLAICADQSVTPFVGTCQPLAAPHLEPPCIYDLNDLLMVFPADDGRNHVFLIDPVLLREFHTLLGVEVADFLM